MTRFGDYVLWYLISSMIVRITTVILGEMKLLILLIENLNFTQIIILRQFIGAGTDSVHFNFDLLVVLVLEDFYFFFVFLTERGFHLYKEKHLPGKSGSLPNTT